MKEYGMFTINEMVEFLTYHKKDIAYADIYKTFKAVCNQHNLMITDIVADIRRARLGDLFEVCERVGCSYEDVINEDEDFGMPIENYASAEEQKGKTYLCDVCDKTYDDFFTAKYEHEHLGCCCANCYWENTCTSCLREFQFTNMGTDGGNGDVYCDKCCEERDK